MPHPNARLTPRGRRELVRLVEDGATLRVAAARCGVAASTACVWLGRWRVASPLERRSLVCLEDRSSRPRRSPRRLASELEQRVCEARRATGWGPRLVAGVVGVPHQTVWSVLRRNGLSRPPRAPRETANRYEWPCPGDLLHMDVSRYARFRRPGHALTGDRSRGARRWGSAATRVGYQYAHAMVDDHSRLAYVELLDDELAATVTGFVERALRFFEAHGINARRVLTDNAFSYVKNRSLAELLAHRDIRHLTTQPYRPRTNGKVERFHQTMAREWGYGVLYRSSAARSDALPHWLCHYNEQRPHSALGNRPPITRVRNLSRQDS
jgi:transposase InsO family protein